jgi:PTH1 family peptidyl-tRNA hydrolase
VGRHLIVGLGNPGPKYAGHRHNIGFMVLDALASEIGAPITRKKFKGQFATGRLEGRDLVLLKPETFMNLSGQSVSPARGFFDVDISDILVVHDELDLPYGRVRLKVGGGHAGHNGLRSIKAELGSGDFARLRVGIGRPERGDVSDYVLSEFTGEDREFLPDTIERAVGALRATLRDGPRRAMNEVNAS